MNTANSNTINQIWLKASYLMPIFSEAGCLSSNGWIQKHENLNTKEH